MPYKDGVPYVQGSDTSHEAAESIADRAASMRAQVADEIRRSGIYGATCDEIEIALGMKHQTASARIKDLKDRGAVRDSGVRRPTRSGCLAVVYVTPREQPSFLTKLRLER